MTSGTCEYCGRYMRLQPIVVEPPDAGTEERSLCRDCAGSRWRVEVVTEALASVLDAIEAHLEEHADVDHDVDQGALVQHANAEARLLAALREARGQGGY